MNEHIAAIARQRRLRFRRVEVVLGCLQRIADRARLDPFRDVTEFVGERDKDILKALLGEGEDQALQRLTDDDANFFGFHALDPLTDGGAS